MAVDPAALDRRLAKLSALVDAWTREAVAASVTPVAARFGAMLEYHLGWRDEQLTPLARPANSGKRLRSGLALLVCEAVAGDIQPARDAAVALELVHNFSLVHDDVQDRSDTRRHRWTVWRLWGDAQAINVGDALFALAQSVLLGDGSPWAAAQVAAINQACLRLVEGQYLDLELQRGALPITIQQYEAMIERKTAALIACATRLGALAGGAEPEAVERLAAFGHELGLAFQEQDDLLGVWGHPDETGKPPAADVAGRKKGLPAVLALGRPDAPAWFRQAYVPDPADLPAEQVERIIQYFDAIGLREAVAGRVRARHDAALAALRQAGGRQPAFGQLEALCESLVSRRM